MGGRDMTAECVACGDIADYCGCEGFVEGPVERCGIDECRCCDVWQTENQQLRKSIDRLLKALLRSVMA